MRVPRREESTETFLDLGVAHVALLEADPRTTDLADAVRQATQRVRQATDEREAAVDVVTATKAVRDRAAFEAKQLLRLLDAELPVGPGRKRRRSPYREVFPAGLDAVIAEPLERRVDLMGMIEGRIREVPRLAHYADRVRAARLKLEETMRVHAEALRRRNDAAKRVERARGDWIREYRASYGALLIRFGQRAHAERYFRQPRDGRRAAGEDGADGSLPSTDGGPSG